MGKFKISSAESFLKRKRVFGSVKEQVWKYLKREMRENADSKPYNTRVANWLSFLKALRYHYYYEAQHTYSRLYSECGPVWYIELSKQQRNILQKLKNNIHEDLVEEAPSRLERALLDLGITTKFTSEMLMSAATESFGDPGLFMWLLYTNYYKTSPSELRSNYSYSSKLMISAIVVIDLPECVDHLAEVTSFPSAPSTIKPKKKTYYYEPKVKYGQYLQKMQIPVYSNHPDEPPKPKKPPPLVTTIKMRSDTSLQKQIMSTDFLTYRKERNIQQSYHVRKCNYKFWEPPPTLRNTDPKMAAYVVMVKVVSEKPNKSFLTYKPPQSNIQFQISSVTYSSGKPVFSLANIVTLPSGYILHNGGYVRTPWTGYITCISGMWNYKKEEVEGCNEECECLANCEATVNEHLHLTECKCSHYYDMKNEPIRIRSNNTFFYPPTATTPLLFDHAKVMDFNQDYVSKVCADVLDSEGAVSSRSEPIVSISDLSTEEALKLFLADLVDTHLLIPHLPHAFRLNNLQEWMRKRIHGPPTAQRHRALKKKAQRRWLELSHIDFRAKSYYIPFTRKERENMNWTHRYLIQKLFVCLLRDFESRTREYQLEQSRLWWPTMHYDVYPSKAFLDVFSAYMPAKYSDTLLLNRYGITL